MIALASLVNMLRLEIAAGGWFERMTPAERKAYVKAHPRSKYAKTGASGAPAVTKARPTSASDPARSFTRTHTLMQSAGHEGMAVTGGKHGKRSSTVGYVPNGDRHARLAQVHNRLSRIGYVKTNDATHVRGGKRDAIHHYAHPDGHTMRVTQDAKTGGVSGVVGTFNRTHVVGEAPRAAATRVATPSAPVKPARARPIALHDTKKPTGPRVDDGRGIPKKKTPSHPTEVRMHDGHDPARIAAHMRDHFGATNHVHDDRNHYEHRLAMSDAHAERLHHHLLAHGWQHEARPTHDVANGPIKGTNNFYGHKNGGRIVLSRRTDADHYEART